MRSAEAELGSERRLSGSLSPRKGACSFCRGDQNEDEKNRRRSHSHGRRILHGRILLLPHLGRCNRTGCIAVGIVRSNLGCDREGQQKPTEQDTQQIQQGGLATGMILCVH